MTKVFLDTNVLFSALLSIHGAAFELFRLAKEEKILLMTSDQCVAELKSLEKNVKFLIPIQDFLKAFPIALITLEKKDSDSYLPYVLDLHDAHVAHGAVQSKAQFLITFNTKDFKRDLIFKDFQIRVLTQGYFLQWLRMNGEY
jgi:putative PIN family toxin of toxin-antitoxin system